MMIAQPTTTVQSILSYQQANPTTQLTVLGILQTDPSIDSSIQGGTCVLGYDPVLNVVIIDNTVPPDTYDPNQVTSPPVTMSAPSVVFQAYAAWVTLSHPITRLGTIATAPNKDPSVQAGIGSVWYDQVTNQLNIDTIS